MMSVFIQWSEKDRLAKPLNSIRTIIGYFTSRKLLARTVRSSSSAGTVGRHRGMWWIRWCAISVAVCKKRRADRDGGRKFSIGPKSFSNETKGREVKQDLVPALYQSFLLFLEVFMHAWWDTTASPCTYLYGRPPNNRARTLRCQPVMGRAAIHPRLFAAVAATTSACASAALWWCAASLTSVLLSLHDSACLRGITGSIQLVPPCATTAA